MATTSLVQLPDHPNLRHLKDQAKDLLKGGAHSSLAAAQFALARRYGFPSWPKLKSYVEALSGDGMGDLERALVDEDLDQLAALLRDDPELIHRQGHWVRRRRHNGYLPLAYAAYSGKVKAMERLLAAGADVHADGEKALRAATYSTAAAATIELLLAHGADLNAVTSTPSGKSLKVIDYPCMALAPEALQCLLAHGAQLSPRSVGLVVASNERKPKAKAACLDAIAAAGFELPATAPMALHRRDTERLAEHLRRDPALLSKTFAEADIFPPEFGIEAPSPYAYVTPLVGGVTLLHIAVELCDLEMAQWLLQHGADVNAPAATDAQGYGGWTPLFHAVATLHQPRSFPEMAALLLRHGADPAVRASIRKPTADDSDNWASWEQVTAAEYARDFIYPDLVNEAALQLVDANGAAV